MDRQIIYIFYCIALCFFFGAIYNNICYSNSNTLYPLGGFVAAGNFA